MGEDGYAGRSANALDTPRGYRPGDVPQTDPHRLYVAKLEVRPEPELSTKLQSFTPPRIGDAPVKGVPLKFAILGRERAAYDSVMLLVGEELKPLAIASREEWSNWVYLDFPAEEGGTVLAAFRFKVIKLSEDGKEFLIYRTEIYPQEGLREAGRGVDEEALGGLRPLLEEAF